MGIFAGSAPRINWFFHFESFSPLQGAIALSYMLSVLLGITKSLSIPIVEPKPSHFGQAPCGVLNVNNDGEGSSKSIPSKLN